MIIFTTIKFIRSTSVIQICWRINFVSSSFNGRKRDNSCCLSGFLSFSLRRFSFPFSLNYHKGEALRYRSFSHSSWYRRAEVRRAARREFVTLARNRSTVLQKVDDRGEGGLREKLIVHRDCDRVDGKRSERTKGRDNLIIAPVYNIH